MKKLGLDIIDNNEREKKVMKMTPISKPLIEREIEREREKKMEL